MSEFPRLKTGVVLQYPATRFLEYATRVVRFTDGTDQRMRLWAAGRRRWVIRLSQLDEQESRALGEFFEEQGGRAGEFPFTDPWDGVTYPKCSLAADVLEGHWRGEEDCAQVLVIRQNTSEET